MANHSVFLQIAGVVAESVVDGPGLRAVVFFQGCPHHCPGCHNPETWDPQGGEKLSLDEVWRRLRYNPLLSGVTFSGGEPLAQPEGALALAKKVRAAGGNVMIYTGYTWEEVQAFSLPAVKELLALTALLVDGPFQLAQKKPDLLFRGSANQRIIDVQRTLAEQKLVLWAGKEDGRDGLATTGGAGN